MCPALIPVFPSCNLDSRYNAMSNFIYSPNDPMLQINRRHFFARTSLGLGSAALGSLLAETVAPAKEPGLDLRKPGASPIDPAYRGVLACAPSSAQGQAGHLPVHERRAVAARSVRLQAGLEPAQRQGPARVGADGPAADGHVGQPGTLPLAGSIFKFAQHGKSGAWISDLLPCTAQGRRRDVLHQIGLHRGDQPRPGDHLLPDRLAARRPAEHGVVAELRPGNDEPEPARLRRA